MLVVCHADAGLKRTTMLPLKHDDNNVARASYVIIALGLSTELQSEGNKGPITTGVTAERVDRIRRGGPNFQTRLRIAGLLMQAANGLCFTHPSTRLIMG